MKKSTYLLTLLLTALFCLPWGSNAWGEELTVGTGENTTEYSPFYGNYVDAKQRNQIVYAISDLSGMSAMEGKNITAIKFYQSNSNAWSGSFTISLAETSGTGFDSKVWFTDELTTVYEGTVTGGSEVTITFQNPYTYEGGNLLLDIQTKTTSSNYKKGTFKGNTSITTKKPAAYAYNGSVTAPYATLWNLPQTTFTYEAAGSATCPKPKDLACTALAATSASFTWNAGGTEGEWQYLCLPANEEPDWNSSSVQTVTSSTATVSVSPATAYKFYIRANCGGSDGQSAAVSAAFKTPCVAVSTLPWDDEDFADVTTGSSVYNIPDCWNRIAYESSWYGTMPYVQNGSSGHSGSGSNYLYFYGGQTPAAIILPAFAEKTGKLAVSFWYKSNTFSYYGDVQIGYMTDPTDATSFTLLKTLDKVADWTFVNAFAMTGAPDDSYIAIRFAGGTSDYCSLYIDDISVGLAPSCVAPGVPSASNITTNSAELTWGANSGETAWKLQYSTDGETWSAEQAVSDNPYTLPDLTSNTLYYVRVKAVCSGSDESAYSEIGSFRTACGTMAALDEKFDTYSASSRPACWEWITYNDGWDDYPMVSASNAFSGSNSLAFSGGGSAATATFAVLPKFEDPINTLALWFYYKNSSTYASYAQLKVGYMLDPAIAGTFVEVATLEKTTDYTKVGPFTFSEAPAGAYIAIQFGGGSSNYGVAYIDNVVVAEAPSCIQPGNLSASSITDEGAVISWNAGGSENNWILQYKRFDGDWSADIPVASTPSYTLTGLEANTNYYVRVKAICAGSDESDWANSIMFKTACGANAMPFEENFSSSTVLPDCWDRSATGTYSWSPYSEYVSGAYNYYIRLRGYSSSYTLSTPSINLSEDAVLKFNWKNGSSTKINANVYISTDGGATKTLLPNDLSTKVTSWTVKTIDLSDYTGETVILYFVSSTGNSTSSYAYLDDVQVIAKPCEALAAPTAAPTMDGGTISWTGNAKALRYQAVGASTWNTVAVTGTSYLLTGLAASASYNVQVQAECATGDDDVWSASLTFTTRCAATDELPYSNNFDAEESEEMPACWSKISATDYPYVYSGTAAYGGTGKFLYFYGSAEQIAVLPALTADLSTLTFSLYYKGGSANFQLGYVKADGVTFVALATLPALTAFGAEPYELDLASIPAEAKYLAIRYSSTSNYASGYVDNVVVKKTPTCFKPASIAASAITANSATVAWTASGKGETQYQYVYVPAGSTPDWAAATLTNELSATVSELEPTTAYDFYVRSYCDTEDQSDAVKASFTTMCAAAALPFEENFDAVADYDMAACWNVYAATYYSAYVANGQLRADAPKTNATVIVLPKLEVSSFAGLAVTFSYSVSNGTLEVGYVTDAEDVSTFTAVGDALTATANTDAVVPLTAGNGNVAFRFKGNTGDGDLWLDNVRVARTEIFSDTEDNASRFAALAAAGETIDVVFNRTMLYNGDYNTLCLPFSLSAAQLANSPLSTFNIKSYDYATIENEELLISIAGAGSIEAGVPYFVANRNNEANKSVQLYKDVVITASTPGKIDNSDVTFQGVFNPVDLAAQTESDSHNELFLAAGNMIYWPAQNKTVKGFRAYFQVKTGGPLKIRKGMPARIVEQANTATGINDIQGDHVQSTKMLVNGQVIIIRNGVKYSITGQKIQ